MRVIIAGCRKGVTQADVDAAMVEFVKRFGPVTEVVSGCALGADAYGQVWAHRMRGLALRRGEGPDAKPTIARYPADWTKGVSAGAVRNIEMGDNADALCAVWDGRSRGTHHMIQVARKRRLMVLVWIIGWGPQEEPTDDGLGATLGVL